jgi:septation ring formation regulator EzrA
MGYTNDYNKLPMDVRVLAGMVITETQINQLLREKNRLRRSYKRNMAEIDAHIKGLREDLDKDILEYSRSRRKDGG